MSRPETPPAPAAKPARRCTCKFARPPRDNPQVRTARRAKPARRRLARRVSCRTNLACSRPQSKRVPGGRADDHRHQQLLRSARQLARRFVRCCIGLRAKLHVFHIAKSLAQCRRQRLLGRIDRRFERLQQNRSQWLVGIEGQGRAAAVASTSIAPVATRLRARCEHRSAVVRREFAARQFRSPSQRLCCFSASTRSNASSTRRSIERARLDAFAQDNRSTSAGSSSRAANRRRR